MHSADFNTLARLYIDLNKIPIYLLMFLLSVEVFASGKDTLQANPSIKKQRTMIVGIAGGASYIGSMIILNEFWYKDYERSRFHFFNDNREWLQMDKIGHTCASYYMGRLGIQTLRWSQIEEKKSVFIGGLAGWYYLTIIETLDGFSEKWGASTGDIIANTLGSSIVIAEELAWHEQRIQLKFSAHLVNYNNDIAARASDLYGKGYAERLLKDYNGQTYWLSINPSSFMKEKAFPKWLNIAIGYGGENMLGGFENSWTEGNMKVNRSDIKRHRQYYFSLDVDLTKFEFKSLVMRSIANAISFIKFPFPAVEYNGLKQLKFHPIYF